MDVTYRPDGGPVQSWTFRPGRVRQTDAERIEARAGTDWDQWVLKLQQGNARARRVLLWHLMGREHPTLRFEDIPDFYMDELEVAYDAGELRDILAQIESGAGVLGADERAGMVEALRLELTAAEAKASAVEVGKAVCEPTESATP